MNALLILILKLFLIAGLIGGMIYIVYKFVPFKNIGSSISNLWDTIETDASSIYSSITSFTS